MNAPPSGEPTSPNSLRRLARMAVVLGAVGSLALMFRMGHRQQSILLIVLFTGWVLAPFVALIAADFRSSGWAPLLRTTLYRLMLFVSLISLALYGRVVVTAPAKPAAAFLLVPLASLAISGIALALASRRAKQVRAR